jgi:DNA-binding transcriptional LysR family regulator
VGKTKQNATDCWSGSQSYNLYRKISACDNITKVDLLNNLFEDCYLDVNQLEVLIAVAKEQSFSRAAQSLHRTQPAVSQAIRRLELELGEPLFDRSSKDGTLTAAGKVLFDFAEQMLNLRQGAHRAIKELKDLQHGKLALSANEYTVMYLLPVLSVFRARHPHIKVEVKRSLASRIASEVLGRGVEIGVVSFKPTDAAIASIPVVMDELALIVAPTHPLADKAIVSVKDLGAESFIAHNVPSPYRERVVKTFEKYKTPLNISMEMPTLESIKRLVEQEMGVALVPRLTAQIEIERKQIVALTVKEMRLERRLQLIFRKGATLSHAAKAFLRVAKGS